MRLNKKQKEEVIRCIGEGLRTDEINQLGERFSKPFQVSRSQVQYYRNKYRVDLDQMTLDADNLALQQGVALKAVRVRKLALLSGMMEEDIFDNGKLWVTREKCIGGGKDGKFIEEDEFNEAEVKQLRGVYDDIAREVGDRRNNVDLDPDDTGKRLVVVYVPDNKRNQEDE